MSAGAAIHLYCATLEVGFACGRRNGVQLRDERAKENEWEDREEHDLWKY